MTRSFLSALAVLAACSAWGEPAIRVSVEQTTVRANNPFGLKVEITGGRSEAPKISDADGLAIEPVPVQRSNQLSIVNGAMSQSQTLIYKATATRPGKVIIPPITARVDGKEISSMPIDLTVLEGKATAPIPRAQQPVRQEAVQDSDAAANAAAPDRTPTPEDAVLVTAEVDKQSVYQGEAVQLTLSRWVLSGVQASPYRSADPGYPDTEGFYTTELEPRQEDRTRGNWPYHLLQLTQKLYPTRTGQLNIGSWQFNGEALMRTSSGRLLRQEYALATDPIAITVKPLPPQPPNFSGAVGTFTFRQSMTAPAPKTAIQGVPFKLSLEVQGDGNPDSIGEPKLPPIAGATVSKADTVAPPNVDSSTGIVTKEFIYTITPLESGKLTIPPIEFCYFDPATERYATQVVGPFDMDARPSAEQAGAAIVTKEIPVTHGKVNITGKDILPNVDAPPSLRPYRPSAVVNITAGVVPALAYAGLAFMMARRRRFEHDSAYARSYFAKSNAHKRLLAVAQAAEPAEELCRAVTGFVADKFNVASAGLTSSDLRQLLETKKTGSELTESIVKIVKACERARYAAVKLSDDEIKALTNAADTAMNKLESVAKDAKV
ncbi:MAG: BatD family protein [Candidatus Hydrogenedentes bacterium]|nr:BatD family protein [Candidatus Hydrogenedentota bacterium]